MLDRRPTVNVVGRLAWVLSFVRSHDKEVTMRVDFTKVTIHSLIDIVGTSRAVPVVGEKLAATGIHELLSRKDWRNEKHFLTTW